jgi:hypothetical protein
MNDNLNDELKEISETFVSDEPELEGVKIEHLVEGEKDSFPIFLVLCFCSLSLFMGKFICYLIH